MRTVLGEWDTLLYYIISLHCRRELAVIDGMGSIIKWWEMTAREDSVQLWGKMASEEIAASDSMGRC